ncbi:MAG: hypothetical protein L3J05_09775 [Robiginitomaculum sp.]|nr:hypothetical protein [Robiginitomaculum sp.]
MQTQQTIDMIPANAQDILQATRQYSSAQKGAIIVAVLGADFARPIVEAIEDKYLHNFVTAMGTIDLVPREVLLATIADFITDMKKRAGSLHGGEKQARELAQDLLSSERAERIFGAPPQTPQAPDNENQDIWQRLQGLPVQRLADYLNEQRPELVSIVLAQLGPLKAGEILVDLSDTVAGSAARHMSSGTEVNAEVISAISELVKIELLETSDVDTSAQAVGFMTDVMGVLPKKRRETLMDIIAKDSPETADNIRKGLLTFEDLPVRLPKSAAPIIFRDMDAKDLLAALKAGVEAAPETTDFLYANISQRMAEQYKEQVDDLPTLSEKQADTAIIALMSFITTKERAGTIAYINVVEKG